VFSANLAMGVTVGVLLSGVFFTFKVARLLRVETETDAAGSRLTYRVSGQVFFASSDVFIEAFDIEAANGQTVIIDVSQAHFWDITAVAALDKVVERFKAHGMTTEVLGLNEASATLIKSLDGTMALKEL
jgi:SulP family sulfate permease